MKKQIKEYDLFEHRHNFAAWAAARAAQRGFKGATHQKLIAALEKCGVKEFARKPPPNISDPEYKKLHSQWCRYIVKNTKMTFGRTAKLIAIYLKSMLICGPGSETQVATIIYPPIDRILLQNIVKEKGRNDLLKEYVWTKLDEQQYDSLIKELSDMVENEPFWTIEKYWKSYKK